MPLKIVNKDILTLKVDALVNSTNHNMYGFSGIDKVLHRMGGPEFEEECIKHRHELHYGEALCTKAYGEPKCKYVIHTYGPGYYDGLQGERVLLKSCYMESLKLADNLACRTVAFPLINAGSMGYPIEEALGIAVTAITEYLNFTKSKLNVTLAIYGATAEAVASKVLAGLDVVMAEADPAPGAAVPAAPPKPVSLDDVVKSSGESFPEVLIRLMNSKGMVDPDVYGALHMPRQTFNKLINGKVKAPKKSTIAGIALVMKLSLAETEELLASAGLAFAPADKFDRIIKYCIENHIYNLYTVNVQLVNYKQKTFYAG